ncbi:DMT family transporter [Salinisphaera sp. RV14]|uniref:DMT family transporter n=1 Tax=unclassified Salinisphaera TaxID=2649847 RepID=UPI003F832CB0
MSWTGMRSSPAAGGVGCIVLAAVILALGDGLVKIASAEISVWQLVFLRALVALPLIAIVMASGASRGGVWPKRVSWVALRSLLLVLMWLLVYLALTRLPLPVVSAGLYSSPIIIALMVAVRPGRSLSRRETVGVTLGFAGVLILLRPGGAAFSPMLLLPLVAAALYAFAAVITASRCREESPVCLALGMQLLFLVVGGIGLVIAPMLAPAGDLGSGVAFLAHGWQAMDIEVFVRLAPLIVGLAVIAVTASIAMARAYQMAPAPMVAAGDYSYLAFSGFWSLVLFGQIPDRLAVLGMALIALAGIAATRGERGRHAVNRGRSEPGHR